MQVSRNPEVYSEISASETSSQADELAGLGAPKLSACTTTMPSTIVAAPSTMTKTNELNRYMAD